MNLFNRLKAMYAPYKIRTQFILQSIVKKKRYLALGLFLTYIPAVMLATSQYPEQTSLWITKHTEYLSDCHIPRALRKVIFGTYAKIYGVNLEEMTRKIDEYETFSQFFTRKIKERKIHREEKTIVSPADSRVLAFGEIKEDSVFVVKGYSYSLGHLICGQETEFSKQDIENMKKDKQNKLYHVVLYLAPGDYHRFHSATNFEVLRRKAIQGALLSVKEKSLVSNKKVYERNSRLLLHGKWELGYFGMILVGALNVGRIVVKDKLKYEVGQEIGYFNLGSTIVMFFQSPEFDWKIEEKQKIQYGQVIGRCGKSEKQVI